MTEKEAKELKKGDRVRIDKDLGPDVGPLFTPGRKYEVDRVEPDGKTIYSKPFDVSKIDKESAGTGGVGLPSDAVEKVKENR